MSKYGRTKEYIKQGCMFVNVYKKNRWWVGVPIRANELYKKHQWTEE